MSNIKTKKMATTGKITNIVIQALDKNGDLYEVNLRNVITMTYMTWMLA